MRNSRQLRFFNNYIIAGLAAVLVFGLDRLFVDCTRPEIGFHCGSPVIANEFGGGFDGAVYRHRDLCRGSTADITNNCCLGL